MSAYDVVNRVTIDAPPGEVWEALVAELCGAGQWWVPHNTFEAGAVPPDRPGGETHVTVHTRGVDRRGLRLRFTARTTEVEPSRRLAVDYVAGAFRGSAAYDLDPIDQGRSTRFSLQFRARPHGLARALSRKIPTAHWAATQDGFRNLAALTGRPAVTRTERRVATDDGAELATTVTGPGGSDAPEGPTVVLVHGWGAARRAWEPVADRLVATGHTVIAFDQRGHGDSTLGREPIGIERLGRDLGAVLEALDVSGTLVAGHSGGGFAVMAHTAADPRGAAVRVRAVALVATAAHGQDTSAGEVRLMGSRIVTWMTRRRRLGARALGQTVGPDPDPATLDTVRRMFAATPARVRADCFRSSRGMDLRAALAEVALPAVVLAGERDQVIDPDLGRAVAEALPDARFELIPEVGHMLPLEAPDRVVTAIAELAGTGPTDDRSNDQPPQPLQAAR